MSNELARSHTGVNGERDPRGRFAPGNTAAVGHAAPLASRVAELRSAMIAAVSPADVEAVVAAMVAAAVAGDVAAARLLLDRACGPVQQEAAVHVSTHNVDAIDWEAVRDEMRKLAEERMLEPPNPKSER